MKSLLFTLAALAAAPLATAQIPAGGEMHVNTYTTGTQWFPGVAVEPDGDFVVTWLSGGQDGSGYGVFGQRYSRAGSLRGGEFQVNTYTTGNQNAFGRPAVAVDKRGQFAVAWASPGDGAGNGIFARRFAANGTPVGAEFQVNTYTAGNQGSIGPYNGIAMGMDPRGNFVVVWTSFQDGNYTGIFGQRYDAGGTRLGAEFQVNSFTGGYQGSPDVSMNRIGDFVVSWSTPDGDGYGAAARRYDAAGNPLGPEFLVNTYTTGDQSYPILLAPTVALSDFNSFVVAWDSVGQDGSGSGVFARRFDVAGNPAGAEFLVNTYTAGGQALSSLNADAVGNFVVAWQSNGQDGSDYGVFGRRFSAVGSPRGLEFRVNTTTTLFQGVPEVDVDEVGNFNVAWHGNGAGEIGNGVFGQRFGGIYAAALAVDTAGNQVIEPGETFDMRPSWLNANGLPQILAGQLSSPFGPVGAEPVIVDGIGIYGSAVPNGSTTTCTDCYVLSVPAPPTRPLHWDGFVGETLVPDEQGQVKIWSLHVGDSFTDVPRSSPYYRLVETLLHHDVTTGCGGPLYCPSVDTTRAQMAVFVLVAKEGAGYAPIPCGATPVFADVPASNPYCRWIEELARRGVVSGCAPGFYCPTAPVSRQEMAVFTLRTLEETLVPAPCSPPNTYNDVPETSPFCPWIEELTNRGVVGGCGGGNYCPTLSVTRDQMSVFIAVTFGLTLYGL